MKWALIVLWENIPFHNYPTSFQLPVAQFEQDCAIDQGQAAGYHYLVRYRRAHLFIVTLIARF